jgi:hypothetical protein
MSRPMIKNSFSLGGAMRATRGTVRMKMQLCHWFFLAAPVLLLGCPGKLDNPDEFLGGDHPEGCFWDIIYKGQNASKGCLGLGCHIDSCANGADPMTCAPAANLRLNWPDLGDGHQLVGRLPEGAFACGPIDAGGTGNMTPIIDPTTPEESLLLKKFEENPVCGARMPFVQRPALTAAEKQCVLDWIKQVPGVAGAPAGDGGGD